MKAFDDFNEKVALDFTVAVGGPQVYPRLDHLKMPRTQLCAGDRVTMQPSGTVWRVDVFRNERRATAASFSNRQDSQAVYLHLRSLTIATCYVCDAEEPLFEGRLPVGWESALVYGDPEMRCPKHRSKNRTFATLADFRAKQ